MVDLLVYTNHRMGDMYYNRMTDRIMVPPQVTMKTKMVMKMKMNKNSPIISPPPRTMNKVDQGRIQVLIRTWGAYKYWSGAHTLSILYYDNIHIIAYYILYSKLSHVMYVILNLKALNINKSKGPCNCKCKQLMMYNT